jgi:hypothetical protein
MKKIYGFTKYYRGGKTPPRHFIYDNKKARDEGLKIAKGQKEVYKTRAWTDKVRK